MAWRLILSSQQRVNVVGYNFSTFRDHSTTISQLDSSKLEIQQARLSQMKAKPPVNKLAFGKVFTDHMLTIDWSKSHGWAAPQIVPFENFSIHPGAKVRNFCKNKIVTDNSVFSHCDPSKHFLSFSKFLVIPLKLV